MKKQSAIALLSITIFFVLNSITPQALWTGNKDKNLSKGRNPANQAKSPLEKYYDDNKEQLPKIPNKIPESQKGKTVMDYYRNAIKPNYLKPSPIALINEPEEVVESKQEDLEGLACKQENADANLELTVKKLVAENEAILKELNELKNNNKKRNKLVLDTPIAPATNHDVFNMMSQISSLMLDHQKQQQDMLNNMYSMMTPTFSFQGPPDMNYSQNSMYTSPMQYISTDYLLGNANIGLALDGAQGLAPMMSPYLTQPQMQLQPAQTQMQLPAVNHPMQSQTMQQPQIPYQNSGFDFGYSTSLGHASSPEFTRIQF